MPDPATSRVGSLIRQLQGALGGKTWRSGQASCVFSGGATSAVATVPHGLGATPSTVTFGAFDLNVDGIALVGLDDTNLQIQARYATGIAGTATIMWHATA